MKIEEESEPEEGEGPDYKAKAIELFEMAKKLVLAVGIDKIAAAAGLMLLAYAIIFVIPHPLSVRITLSSMDYDKPVVGASIRAEYDAFPFGHSRTLAVEPEDGSYVFKSLPSHTYITLTFSRDGYKNKEMTLTTGDGDDSKRVYLYTDSGLTLAEGSLADSIGATCTKTFYATVKNAGTADANSVELISEGDLPNFNAQSADLIASADQARIPFTLTTTQPDDSGEGYAPISGAVRIRGTDQSMDVNLSVVGKNLLDVSPNDLRLQLNSHETVEIKNNGKTKVSNVTIALDNGLRGILELNLGPLLMPFEVAPDSDIKVFVTAKGEGYGIITVNADCNPPHQITVIASSR